MVYEKLYWMLIKKMINLDYILLCILALEANAACKKKRIHFVSNKKKDEKRASCVYAKEERYPSSLNFNTTKNELRSCSEMDERKLYE